MLIYLYGGIQIFHDTWSAQTNTCKRIDHTAPCGCGCGWIRNRTLVFYFWFWFIQTVDVKNTVSEDGSEEVHKILSKILRQFSVFAFPVVQSFWASFWLITFCHFLISKCQILCFICHSEKITEIQK